MIGLFDENSLSSNNPHLTIINYQQSLVSHWNIKNLNLPKEKKRKEKKRKCPSIPITFNKIAQLENKFFSLHLSLRKGREKKKRNVEIIFF